MEYNITKSSRFYWSILPFARMYYFSFSFCVFPNLYHKDIWCEYILWSVLKISLWRMCVYTHMWNLQIFKEIFNSPWFPANTWYIGPLRDGASLFACKDLTTVRGLVLVRAGPDTGPYRILSCHHNRTLMLFFLFHIWQIRKLRLRGQISCVRSNRLFVNKKRLKKRSPWLLRWLPVYAIPYESAE